MHLLSTKRRYYLPKQEQIFQQKCNVQDNKQKSEAYIFRRNNSEPPEGSKEPDSVLYKSNIQYPDMSSSINI